MTRGRKLLVSVVHGNLAFARHLVVVGHYEGDFLVGAEAALDRLLQGELSLHHQRGGYPEHIGSAEVYLSEGLGAVVVGLGRVGGLTPRLLEEAFLSGILRLASVVEQRAVTTLLLGTMADVLTIEQSITAMLRAIQSLAAAGVFIASLEIIELWEDRALQAHAVLTRLAAGGTDLQVEFQVRDGGLRRLAVAEEDIWWSRLRITQATANGPFQVALFTNRARTETEECGSSEAAAARFREYFAGLSRVVLMVDQNSASIPWELLCDGRSRPLAVDAALIRQLDVDDYRPVVIHPGEPTALVVGNPQTTSWASLPGAEEEGRQVAAILERLDVTVTVHLQAPGAEIRRDLRFGAYRILHLAGHGVYGAVNGMVLGDGDVLTAADVGRMPIVPELVFLNCCHLGRMAANIAVEFIRLGVRAVLAAGWDVDDAAAATFARGFYGSFLGGATFGEAVRVARERAFTQHPGVNTWGAYQCYGDPGYLFNKANRPARMALPSQLVAALNNLASKAKVAREGDRVRLALTKLKQEVTGWWDLPEVEAAEASLLGELGDFHQAIELYGRASASGETPLRAVEQEANLRVRAAARDLSANAIELPDFLKQIELAIAKIDAALSFGETAERYWIKASAYKRKAVFIDDDGERVRALEAMIECYRRADLPVNAQLGKVIRGWFTDAVPVSIEMGSLNEDEPSFWNAVREPDVRLVQLLVAGRGGGVEEIARLYRQARRRGGSPREGATIFEHLEFCAAMARRAGKLELEAELRRIMELM